MTKKRNFIAKREQRFQRKLAVEYSKAASQHVISLNVCAELTVPAIMMLLIAQFSAGHTFSTPKQTSDALEMQGTRTNHALDRNISRPHSVINNTNTPFSPEFHNQAFQQASAPKAGSNKERCLKVSTDVTYKTIMTKLFQSPNQAIICRDSARGTDYEVKISCSPSAEKLYQEHPFSYQKDVETLEAMLGKVTQDKAIHCKLLAIKGHKEFQINMQTSEEMTGVNGRSQLFSGIISLRRGISDTTRARSTLRHEMHHSFICRQNALNKRNYHEKSDRSTNTPYDQQKRKMGEVSVDEFENIIKLGIARIETAVMIVAKKEARMRLLPEEDEMLFNLKKAAATYTPHPITESADTNYLERQIEQGVLSRDHQVVGKPYFFVGDKIKIKMTVTGFEKDSTVVDPENPRFVVTYNTVEKVQTILDKIMAALLDGYYFLTQTVPTYKRANEAHTRESRAIESDAYLHQLYELYPKFFKLIFPELVEHHHQRTHESFKSCLRN